MSPEFEQALIASGARMQAGAIIDFGDAASEREASGTKCIVVPLSALSALEFTGVDAEVFLHGQLSCDVRALSPGAATYGAYCSPQGRVLASFLLMRLESAFLMLLPESVAQPIKKRIGMYVLRSKVKIADAQTTLLGVGSVAGRAEPVKPVGQAMTWIREADGTLRLTLDASRLLLIAPQEVAHLRWQALARDCRPAGPDCWEWLDIRAGIPWIGSATREEFIPQMANLDLVGGVSFSKGCYPGQEIVARTQFRGQVKRRMFLAHLDAPEAPRAGDPLFSDDHGEQASGKIVAAQASPGGGYDLLAVVTIASKDASIVRIGSGAGPALTFQPLPYAMP